jgi:non-ribosomal peptide synthetase component F
VRDAGAGAPSGSAARVTEIEIDEARRARLEEVARATTTTMPMMILTGLLLALRRHCGQHQLTVPIYASGRGRPELEKVMGSLATSHLVTVDFAGAPTGRACLGRVRDAVLEAGDEQELSMTEYARLDGLAPDAIRFPVEMNYLPDIEVPTGLGEATITELPRQTPYTLGGDIMLIVRRVGERLRLSFGYAADVVDDDDMARLAADTAALLGELADDLDGVVEPLPVGPPAISRPV